MSSLATDLGVCECLLLSQAAKICHLPCKTNKIHCHLRRLLNTTSNYAINVANLIYTDISNGHRFTRLKLLDIIE